MRVNTIVQLVLLHLYITAFILMPGCHQYSLESSLPSSPVSTQDTFLDARETKPPALNVNAWVIISHDNLADQVWSDEVVDMGWLSDGRVFYAIGDPLLYGLNSSNDLDWYAYDSKNQLSQSIRNPQRMITPEMLTAISQDGKIEILSALISPTENTILYMRLPDGYQRPPSTSGEYVDPAELWVIEKIYNAYEETIGHPLLNGDDNLYDCGFALSTESRWFDNETLVFGSCYFTYGITRVYFLADLLNDTVQFLDFETSGGEYIPSEHIAVAHNSPSLAFYTEGGFWIVPVEEGQREIPLTLTEMNFLFDDHPAMGPIWSSDDQWIYYWTSGSPTKFDPNGFVEYQPWWLEKINVSTKQRDVVLNEQQLLSVMGYDMYRRGAPYGFGNPWRLSPSDDQILLFLSETVDTPATLFLISLPDK